MHVLQLSEDYYPITAGGAFEDHHVAKEMAASGDSVTVFTFRPESCPDRETVDAVDIRRPVDRSFDNTATSSLLSLVGRAASLLLLAASVGNYLRTHNVDVLHSTNHLMHPLATVMGLLFSIPVANFVAYTPSLDVDDRQLTNPMYLLEQLNFSTFMGDTINCRNYTIRNEIASHNPDATVQVVHGILDTDVLADIQYRVDLASDRTQIAFVGRLTPLKSPERAIEVLSQLTHDYELTVVGDGVQYDTTKEAATDLLCADRVDLLGELSHEETLEILLASDVLLLTSDVESYPTVVFEAVACACEVVAPPVGILPTIESTIPQLHVVDRESYPSAIERAGNGGHEIDWDFAEANSIQTFAETVSHSISEAASA